MSRARSRLGCCCSAVACCVQKRRMKSRVSAMLYTQGAVKGRDRRSLLLAGQKGLLTTSAAASLAPGHGTRMQSGRAAMLRRLGEPATPRMPAHIARRMYEDGPLEAAACIRQCQQLQLRSSGHLAR